MNKRITLLVSNELVYIMQNYLCGKMRNDSHNTRFYQISHFITLQILSIIFVWDAGMQMYRPY